MSIVELVPTEEEDIRQEMLATMSEAAEELQEDWAEMAGGMIAVVMDGGRIEVKYCNLDAGDAIIMFEALKSRCVEAINELSEPDWDEDE